MPGGDSLAPESLPQERKGPSSKKSIFFGVALLLAAVAGYIFWKSKA
jgi:hypothetical protein